MDKLPDLPEVFTEKKKFILTGFLIILGLSSGFATSQIMNDSSETSYCDSIESSVVQSNNFSGTLACFPPGIVEVNLSEEVENNSDLKCVCRHSYNGVVQMIPISVSN